MNNENKPSNAAASENISANNSNNTKPQLGAEQIKLLLSSMQKNQKEQSTFKKNLQSFINYIMKFTQRCVTQLDFFIKYVINKHELDKNDVMNTARGPVMFGTYVIFIFVILGGGWVVLAPLDSAERAIGFVIPSSKRKLIQSPQGGTIKEIYVLLGDQVKAGEPIVALDEVQAKAQYEVSLNQYKTYLATEARLVAERDNLKEIPFDQFLLDRKDEPHVATLLRSEDLLFQSRQETYKKTLESLTQRHLQLEKQLEGLNARKQSAIKNKAVNRELLKSYRDLYNKGHLQKAKLLEFEAKTAEVESNLLVTESEIAKINESILEDEANALRFKSENLSKILDEFNKFHAAKNEALEKYLASKDALDKIILRSPVDGTVIEIHTTTIGGVIGAGSTVAEILPLNDKLIVEAKIASKDIASVHVGLKAKIKFSAFKSRTTPVFSGTVSSLSPDVIHEKSPDQRQDSASYIAKIEIDMEDFNRVAKKNKLVLRPGMQVEVNIVTGTRTLARYLLDPITDSMFKAFKEK